MQNQYMESGHLVKMAVHVGTMASNSASWLVTVALQGEAGSL